MPLTPLSHPRTRTRTRPHSRLRPALVALLGAACLGGLLTAPAAGAASDGGSEGALQRQLEELVRTPEVRRV